MPARFTVYPNDRKCKNLVCKLDVPFVRTITDETTGMTTGTGNEVQVERIDRIIIKILRNKVVVFCLNCYHKHGCSVNISYVWVKAEVKLWSGRFLLFHYTVTKQYDNTRSLRIKQSDGKYIRFHYAGTSFILIEKWEISLI